MTNTHKKQIRIALVGIGNISPYYMKAIKENPQCELIAVCDHNIEKKALYPELTFTNSLHTLLKLNIDAVILCLPHQEHEQAVRECALASKHILCEKPLSMTAQNTMMLHALAKKQNITLMTAYHRLYNQNVHALNEWLKTAGTIKQVNCTYIEDIEIPVSLTKWHWQRNYGGGCIFDNAPNVFCVLIKYLSNINITSVKRTYPDVEDVNIAEKHAMIQFSFNGGHGTLELDWQANHEDKKLQFITTDGNTFTCDYLEGFTGYKSSLWHEYEAMVEDFIQNIINNKSSEQIDAEIAQILDETHVTTSLNKSEECRKI